MRAFSLIEVMVVVVIVGVLAAASVPSLLQARQRARSDEVAQQIESLIGSARDTARLELRCVTVAVESNRTLIASVHPCTSTSFYATAYASGVPANVERSLFRLDIPSEVGTLILGECTTPLCAATPFHGFGRLLEIRTDGSTDCSYGFTLDRPGSTPVRWRLFPTTGTMRRGP